MLRLQLAATVATALFGAIIVVDGDTVKMDGTRYRLLGFDTPEHTGRAAILSGWPGKPRPRGSRSCSRRVKWASHPPARAASGAASARVSTSMARMWLTSWSARGMRCATPAAALAKIGARKSRDLCNDPFGSPTRDTMRSSSALLSLLPLSSVWRLMLLPFLVAGTQI